MPTLVANTPVSLTLAAGEKLGIVSASGIYIVGPVVGSSRPTANEQLDPAGTWIGPVSESTTVTIRPTTAGEYAVMPAPDALYGPESANYRALVSGAGNLVGDRIAAPVTNLTAATGAAGALTGAYYYATTFVSAQGETAPWPGTATVVNPSSQQVNLTNIPVGPAGTIARRIYRTPATPTDPKDYRFLAEIADNTTTTYTDNTADGSLGSPVNWNATNRGVLTDGSVPLLRASDQSTGVGYQAFANNVGYASTAIGYQSQYSITTGRRNVSMGTYALQLCTTGYQNTAVGVHAGNGLTAGIANTLIGYAAGGVTAAPLNFNVAIGNEAFAGSGAATGSGNVAVGYRALQNINTADQCVGVGYFAGRYANASRQLFIDTGGDRTSLALSQSDGLIYGEIPNAGNVQTQRINLNGSVRLGSSTSPTVANLPAATAALQGCRRYVTDSSVPAAGNYGATVAGGGSNCVPVFCNGTNWIIG